MAFGAAAPFTSPQVVGANFCMGQRAAAAGTSTQPEMVPNAAQEATRAQEMFVVGTAWPSESKVGASATVPTKGLVLFVHKAVVDWSEAHIARRLPLLSGPRAVTRLRIPSEAAGFNSPVGQPGGLLLVRLHKVRSRPKPSNAMPFTSRSLC